MPNWAGNASYDPGDSIKYPARQANPTVESIWSVDLLRLLVVKQISLF